MRFAALAAAALGLTVGLATAGVARVSAEHTWIQPQQANYSWPTFSNDNTGFVYGLGVEGKLTRTMSARLEYLAYETDNAHSHSDTVGVIRAGLNIKLNP